MQASSVPTPSRLLLCNTWADETALSPYPASMAHASLVLTCIKDQWWEANQLACWNGCCHVAMLPNAYVLTCAVLQASQSSPAPGPDTPAAQQMPSEYAPRPVRLAFESPPERTGVLKPSCS